MRSQLRLIALLLAPAATSAQELSARASEQLQEVKTAVSRLSTPTDAQAAGFRPVLGNIPTMGTHWVNIARMRDTSRFDLAKPDQLMFSTIDGQETLVGVAYGYRGPRGKTPPEAFDGDLDHWHDHPELAPAGETLTMLHVWFVPSPDGPFAGHNPWLSFYALGLTPPSDATLADPDASVRVRTLALALAEADAPTMFRQGIARFAGPDLAKKLDERRDAIRAIVPDLANASKRGDQKAWDAAADRANAEWKVIRQAYLDAIPTDRGRERLQKFYEEAIGGGHEHRHS
jgi:hypothetical protein